MLKDQLGILIPSVVVLRDVHGSYPKGYEIQGWHLDLFSTRVTMYTPSGILLNLYDIRNHYTSPYLAGCLFLIIVCVVTRIATGLRSNLNSSFVPGPKEVGVVPYSVPWLGSALPFGIHFQDFLADCQYVDGAV